MHEILAPLFFVIYSDQQTCLHAIELELLKENDAIDREIIKLLDPKYYEHDAYFLFQQVMETIEPWYSQDALLKNSLSLNFEPFIASKEPTLWSVLGVKLKMIYSHILKKHDAQLYNYLQDLQITPQIFGLRWLRLLFGREFAMQDLLVIWDAIFANGLSFSLCDYIFVAMLMIVRKPLLEGDYSQCMGYLMRYPSISDVHYVVDMALYLKDPLNYAKPSNYAAQVLTSPPTSYGNPTLRRDHLMLTAAVPTRPTIPTSSKPSKNVYRPQSLSLSSLSSDNHSSVVKPFKTPAITSSYSLPANNVKSLNKPVDRELKTMVASNERPNTEKLDYCWKHMTSQIETLQKCLANQALRSEDEIFVALAELKKVRDILKGSLKINDELTAPD